MKFTLDQRTQLDALIDQHAGDAFSREAVIEDYADYLREQAEEGELGDVLHSLARSAVTDKLGQRSWSVESDEQVALFNPEALLSLGDDEYIHMRDARADHLERHRIILDKNFEDVARAHFAKTKYIGNRLPYLRERGCTLGEYEGADDLPEAA